jgi:hypothetical protein
VIMKRLHLTPLIEAVNKDPKLVKLRRDVAEKYQQMHGNLAAGESRIIAAAIFKAAGFNSPKDVELSVKEGKMMITDVSDIEPIDKIVNNLKAQGIDANATNYWIPLRTTSFGRRGTIYTGGRLRVGLSIETSSLATLEPLVMKHAAEAIKSLPPTITMGWRSLRGVDKDNYDHVLGAKIKDAGAKVGR